MVGNGASMTAAQKIAVRLSEVRRKLNELSALEGDDFTDEKRAELEALSKEYDSLEVRHAAAIRAEGEEEAAAQGAEGNGDGEPAEVRRLLQNVRLTDYLTPAAGGTGLVGAAAELNAALEVPVIGPGGGIAVPWAMLELEPEQRRDQGDGTERRAFTTTTNYDGPTRQRPILQRLFGMDILGALGVRIDSVPAGMTEWPLITGGVAPDQRAEGTARPARPWRRRSLPRL